jgi:thiol-disulfide isomerase/thioredoxin
MLGTADSVAAQTAATLELDPVGARAARLGYYPILIKLVDSRPEGVKKEPTYAGAPKYGVFTVGNGPRSLHCLALDEPAGGTWKIFVDLNGDGDLTSSGEGTWTKKTVNSREMYGVDSYVVRASYGTPEHETSSAGYGLAFYRFVGSNVVLMYREAARRGTILVDGKPHSMLLAENDADAIYSKALDDEGKPVSSSSLHPVWLMLDVNEEGKWGQPLDVRSPFKLGDKTYVADIAPDGSEIRLSETTRPVPVPKAAPQPKQLLSAGSIAPDFEAEAWGGGLLHLSDFKGKVVVLDFWSTWCPPCQKSLPHIEKIYQATKDQDVVVLGVCVWDEKEAYSKWVPEKKDVYHFRFAFDPAGRNTVKAIASEKYNVNGIPTTYIIDKDGKVAASVVGYDDGDNRIEAALGKLGVSTQASTDQLLHAGSGEAGNK